MTTTFRLFFFFFVVIPCAAFSTLQWIYRYIFRRKTMNAQDSIRTSNFFGIPYAGSGNPFHHSTQQSSIHPTAPAWDRLSKGDADHDPYAFHLIKDIMSEWVKDDNQRAGKVLSFIIVFTVSILVLETVIFLLFIYLLPGATAMETLTYLFSPTNDFSTAAQ